MAIKKKALSLYMSYAMCTFICQHSGPTQKYILPRIDLCILIQFTFHMLHYFYRFNSSAVLLLGMWLEDSCVANTVYKMYFFEFQFLTIFSITSYYLLMETLY